jgi:hypothetical protein
VEKRKVMMKIKVTLKKFSRKGEILEMGVTRKIA